jgi:hypothetical protein
VQYLGEARYPEDVKDLRADVAEGQAAARSVQPLVQGDEVTQPAGRNKIHAGKVQMERGLARPFWHHFSDGLVIPARENPLGHGDHGYTAAASHLQGPAGGLR